MLAARGDLRLHHRTHYDATAASTAGGSASLDHTERPYAARLRHAAQIFSMLGEPTRLELLWLMTQGPQTVTELVDVVDASRTSVSQHLAKLRHAGVVDVVREGRTAYYSLRVERLLREGMNHADHVISGEQPHH